MSQHYLRHPQDAHRIAQLLSSKGYAHALEIGAGTGALTQALMGLPCALSAIEKDADNVAHLRARFGDALHLVCADAVQIDWLELTSSPFALVGNFPYHITSKLLFSVLDYRCHIPEVVCMVQKEVGQRLCSPPGSKVYGMLSVLMQAFYSIESCFVLSAARFIPPPRVESMVLRMRRVCTSLPVPYARYLTVVRAAFAHRRKMLRSALAGLPNQPVPEWAATRRAETLSPCDFIKLCMHLFPSDVQPSTARD